LIRGYCHKPSPYRLGAGEIVEAVANHHDLFGGHALSRQYATQILCLASRSTQCSVQIYRQSTPAKQLTKIARWRGRINPNTKTPALQSGESVARSTALWRRQDSAGTTSTIGVSQCAALSFDALDIAARIEQSCNIRIDRIAIAALGTSFGKGVRAARQMRYDGAVASLFHAV